MLVEGFPESDPMNTPRVCVSADAVLPLASVRSPNTIALPSDAIVTNSSELHIPFAPGVVMTPPPITPRTPFETPAAKCLPTAKSAISNALPVDEIVID